MTFGALCAFANSLALENIFHPFQPFMIGQKCFALRWLCFLTFHWFSTVNEGIWQPVEDNADAQRSYDYFAVSPEEELF